LYSAISRIVSDRFLLRRIDEAARVDHDDIGVGGCGVSSCPEAVSWPIINLCIDKVFRASETDKSYFQK